MKKDTMKPEQKKPDTALPISGKINIMIRKITRDDRDISKQYKC